MFLFPRGAWYHAPVLARRCRFMKINTLGVLAVLLMAGLAGGLATEVRAQGRPTTFIQKIVVKGNQKVSRSQITRIIGVKPGEGYDPERIRPGIRRLYETHQFRDVRALREAGTASDSVNIVIEVVEFPRVELPPQPSPSPLRTRHPRPADAARARCPAAAVSGRAQIPHPPLRFAVVVPRACLCGQAPASPTMRKSASGHTRARSQALFTGVTTS